MNAKTSATMKGRPPNNAEWMKNTFWWNNGSINKRSKECPGEGWVRGTVKKTIQQEYKKFPHPFILIITLAQRSMKLDSMKIFQQSL